MTVSRRFWIKRTGVAVGIMALATTVWGYDGFLRGTWIVRCPNGHNDQVEDITRNHDCEKCGAKAVSGGSANVVCPVGHATHVEGITESHICSQRNPDGSMCGRQCRR